MCCSNSEVSDQKNEQCRGLGPQLCLERYTGFSETLLVFLKRLAEESERHVLHQQPVLSLQQQTGA